MLNFNKEAHTRTRKEASNLNTSHVKLQPFMFIHFLPPKHNLNTSHVKLQQWKYIRQIVPITNLNTSHVKLQQ